MSRAKRPRKAYRPRLIGRPVLETIRAQLILPAYLAVETLRAGTDPAALESARHTLAALFNYMGVACRLAARSEAQLEPIEAAKRALIAVIDRNHKLDLWRCTGPELQAIRVGIVSCDSELPHLRTDHIQAAVLNVDATLFGTAIPSHLRVDQRIELEEAKSP